MANGEEGLGCLLIAGLAIWGGSAGWDQIKKWQKPTNNCPAVIDAHPDWSASGISWGTGKVHPMEATIHSVAAECIPPDAPGEKSALPGYSVAVTATVNYMGTSDWFTYSNHDETVVFECQTKNHVVLGSQESPMHFVRNGGDGTVSAKITGLTGEEISRMDSVTVRWKYGQ